MFRTVPEYLKARMMHEKFSAVAEIGTVRGYYQGHRASSHLTHRSVLMIVSRLVAASTNLA